MMWTFLALFGCNTGTEKLQIDSGSLDNVIDSGNTEDTGLEDCSTADMAFFETEAVPLLQNRCLGCHNADSVAATTRHVLLPFDSAENIALNFEHLRSLAVDTVDGAELLLNKPSGQESHGGGEVVDMLTPEYATLSEMVARFIDPGHCENPGTPPMTCEANGVYPGPSPFRRLTDVQYRNSVFDLMGIDVAEGLFPETKRAEDFRTWSANNVVSSGGAEGILMAAEYISQNANLENLMACESQETERVCSERYLSELAVLAYRRPLTSSELAIVLSYLDSGISISTAVQMGIEIIFNSPQFLYIDASGANPIESDTTIEQLDQYAIASRLSYFFLNTTPDTQLMTAAASNNLQNRSQIREQATRLAQDPRFLKTLTAFHEDWLNLYQLDGADRDETMYPQFSENLVEAMRIETDLFVTEVLWSGEVKYEDLFFSDMTWVNSDLAQLYNLPDPGPGWHRIQLDETRPGILTRSAFLAAHAYTGSSAPIKRGHFILKEMLCEELSVPPDVNTVIPEESEEASTIRERLTQHQSDPSCAGCHNKIDPIGFSFEHFDAVGAWRDNWESGIPIDATGDLNLGSFNDAAEMIAMVATTDTAKECYSIRWFEYALGRPAEVADLCSLDMLQQRFIASDGNIQSLMVDIAMTDAFLYRFSLEAQ